MTDTPVAVTTKPSPTAPAAVRRQRLFLVAALIFVVASRLILYAWSSGQTSEFDLLYNAALQLLRGENPYQLASQWFPYPLPAVLVVVPFTILPLEFARPVFDILVGWAFVAALWKYRGPVAVLAVLSGAYLFAMLNGQTTPLMVAASLVPALGFLLVVKPTTSAPLWISRPSRTALLGALAFLALSLVVLPSWPLDWWTTLQRDSIRLVPPVIRPFGFLLLLAALRWRMPEARLLLATAFVPQNILPYELVSLALIPANRMEMGIYIAGTWLAVGLADRLNPGLGIAEWAGASWPAMLCAGYLPMLVLVLRRPSGVKAPRVGKERRRPHRLKDTELRVEVTPNPAGGVTATVTHLPTKKSAAESGPTREAAVRKAQDRLAGILAGNREERKEA